MCGDWHQAEDVVQNVFIKLYSAWGRIQRPATIAALRAGAEQRCSQQTGRPAVTPLPASAGATGFVQSWSGGGQGYVQVGDTILLVRVRYGAGDGTQQGVPDAMTPADVGLVTVAKQAATRAAAATGKG